MKGFHVRRGAHWMVVSLFLTVAGCGGDSGTNGGGDSGTNGGGDGGDGGGAAPVVTTAVTVGSGGNVFTPPDIQVLPSATVTWTWNTGGVGHNVTFVSTVSAPSDTQMTGTFQVVMPMAPATYNYECTIHAGMNGSVTVSS